VIRSGSPISRPSRKDRLSREDAEKFCYEKIFDRIYRINRKTTGHGQVGSWSLAFIVLAVLFRKDL
jgi:hypothetical protein